MFPCAAPTRIVLEAAREETGDDTRATAERCEPTDGGALGLTEARRARVSVCASRSIERSSRALATRAKELLRRHALMTCTAPAGTRGGNSGSSRRMAAIVVDPP